MKRARSEAPTAGAAGAEPTAAYRDHLDTISRHVETGLERAGLSGIAIFAGRPRLRFLDDHAYPFTPNPHFQWWVPLSEHPDCWIYFEPGARPRLIFVQPDDYWHLPPRDPEGFWCDSFDLRVVSSADGARAELPAQLAHIGAIGEADLLPDWGFAAINPEPLIAYLHWQRARKTEYELDCLRRASERAVRGHRAAARAFHQGGSEYDLHLAYLRAVSAVDDEQPYANIVALNEHAAVLHYQHRERAAPARPRSFLIDAGASHHGYASDITRTYSAEPGAFEDLVTALDQRQRALGAAVRDGVEFADLHRRAHRDTAELLADFGLVRGTPEAIVETGISRAFFPHGLGHFLGLQVHDVGGHQASPSGGSAPPPEDHPHLRLTRTLEPGHVVTIEPGLYFIDPLLAALRDGPHGRQVDWDRVERLRPWGGIRIEDDVAVTTGEPENLTRDAFAATADPA